MNNSGSYTCRASNEYGTSVRHFLLIIGSKEEGEGGGERRDREMEVKKRGGGERELVGVQMKKGGTSPTLILHNHLL